MPRVISLNAAFDGNCRCTAREVGWNGRAKKRRASGGAQGKLVLFWTVKDCRQASDWANIRMATTARSQARVSGKEKRVISEACWESQELRRSKIR